MDINDKGVKKISANGSVRLAAWLPGVYGRAIKIAALYFRLCQTSSVWEVNTDKAAISALCLTHGLTSPYDEIKYCVFSKETSNWANGGVPLHVRHAPTAMAWTSIAAALPHKGPFMERYLKSRKQAQADVSCASAAASVPWLSRRRRIGLSYRPAVIERFCLSASTLPNSIFEGCIGQLLLVLF